MTQQQIERAIVRATVKYSFGEPSDSYSIHTWVRFVNMANTHYKADHPAVIAINNIFAMIDDMGDE